MDFLLYIIVILSAHVFTALIVQVGDKVQEEIMSEALKQVVHISDSGNIIDKNENGKNQQHEDYNFPQRDENNIEMSPSYNKKQNKIRQDISIPYKNDISHRAAMLIQLTSNLWHKATGPTTRDSAKEHISLKPHKMYGEYDYVVRVYDKSMSSSPKNVFVIEEYLLSKAELSNLSELQMYTLNFTLNLSKVPNYTYFRLHGLMLSQGNEASKDWRELECFSRDGHPVFYVVNKSYPVRIHECGPYGESKHIISSDINWCTCIGDDGEKRRMYYVTLNAPFSCKAFQKYKISFVANNYSFVEYLSTYGYDHRMKRQSFVPVEKPPDAQLSSNMKFLHVYKVGGVKKHFYNTCIARIEDMEYVHFDIFNQLYEHYTIANRNSKVKPTFTISEDSLEVWKTRPSEEGDEYCYIITDLVEPPSYNDPDKKCVEYEVLQDKDGSRVKNSYYLKYKDKCKVPYDILQPRKRSKRV